MLCNVGIRRRATSRLPHAPATWAVLAAAGAALAAPAPASAARLTPVATGLEAPVYLAAPPGDGRRLMVVEQGGAVRVVRDGVKLDEPFLTIGPAGFSNGGERGLLSIAFAPDYEQSRLLYAYYTDAEGDIRVDELRRAADSRDVVEAGYRRQVIEIPHREAANHNGGTLQFGPDGFLYLATGDGGGSYDEPIDDARDPASLLGKVLRIDPTPGGGYSSPADNPFFGPGVPGADEVWSIGLRNPFRFSFDRATRDLLIADVGERRVEEIDFAPNATGGAGRGLDFGWDRCEGSLAIQGEPQSTSGEPCELGGDTLPIVEHLRPESGFCSITGGYVVRDPSVAELAGRYVYGDLCTDTLRSVSPTAPGDDRAEDALAVQQLVGFGEDACGRVYTVEYGGTVSRLEGDAPRACDARVAEPGGEPPGGEGPAVDPPPAAPAEAVSVRLAGRRRQRALRQRGVVVRVRCGRRCRVRLVGTISIGRSRGTLRLRQVRRRLRGGRTLRVRLRLRPAARRALRRALTDRRSTVAAVTVRARGANGRLRVASRRFRVVR